MIGLIGSTLGVVSGMAGAYALVSGGGPPRPGVGGPGGAQPQITPIFMPSDIVNVWTLSIILSIVVWFVSFLESLRTVTHTCTKEIIIIRVWPLTKKLRGNDFRQCLKNNLTF